MNLRFHHVGGSAVKSVMNLTPAYKILWVGGGGGGGQSCGISPSFIASFE